MSESPQHVTTPAGIRPRTVSRVERKPTVLTTAAAERLVTALDRTVTALGSLAIANDFGRRGDVRCLARTLINDLESEACLLRDQLEQLRDRRELDGREHEPGRAS